MIINLKQITVFDSGNILLDKINYNFDQLIVNGGGPKGYSGTDGLTGPQGFSGSRGVNGAQGLVGSQGGVSEEAQSYWISEPSTSGFRATLIPKIGDGQYSSIIAAGYVTEDNKYNNQQSNDGIQTYQWIVNRKDNVLSNISLKCGDLKAFNIKITSGENDNNYFGVLDIGFVDNINGTVDSQLNIESDSFEINESQFGGLLLKTNKDGGEIRVDSIFKNTVRFNKKLSLKNSGADFNKIVTSVDNTGLVTFKTSAELGGSVKVGTIISILPSIYFDPNNFMMSQEIDASNGTPNQNIPLQIKIGAGLNDYKGWYICNGETWKNNGNIAFPPQDINGFGYIIVGNPASKDPNSQGGIKTESTGTRLIGGAEIKVDAILLPNTESAQYVIDSTAIVSDKHFSSTLGTVQNGLILNLDVRNLNSYPGTGTTWTDLSGNNNIGTFVNGPTFNSANGGSIVFNGSNARVSLSGTKFTTINNPNLSQENKSATLNVAPWYPVYNNFTYEFVCKPTGTINIVAESTSLSTGTTGQRYITRDNKSTDGKINGNFIVSVGTNAIQVFDHGDAYMPCLLSHTVSTTTTVNIAITVVNKRPSLYVNGVFIKNGLTSTKPNVELSGLNPGVCSTTYPPFSGNISIFKYYNRTLLAQEVLQNYKATQGRFETTYHVKKLPQIIYLGVDDLYWEQKGTGQALAGDYSAIDYSTGDYLVS
jgi:hypothetical protein